MQMTRQCICCFFCPVFFNMWLFHSKSPNSHIVLSLARDLISLHAAATCWKCVPLESVSAHDPCHLFHLRLRCSSAWGDNVSF